MAENQPYGHGRQMPDLSTKIVDKHMDNLTATRNNTVITMGCTRCSNTGQPPDLPKSAYMLRSASADQAHENHDDGDDEQYMDKATNGIRGDESQQPQNDQNHCNRI